MPKLVRDILIEEGFTNLPETGYPYRCTFDLEVLFDTIERSPSGKLRFVNKLIPASVSVVSNFPDYEYPKCSVSNGDSEEAISDMFKHMEDISAKAHELLMMQYGDVYKEVNARAKEHKRWKEKMKELKKRKIEPSNELQGKVAESS